MSEVLIPPWIIPEEEPQEPLDEGSSVFRATFAPGLAQRQSYGGLRLKLARRHTVRLEEKAQLLAALRATRGSYNVVRTKVHFALRGSFPATELLSNNTFANGTTGWTSLLGAQTSVSVHDRVLRLTRTGAGGTGLSAGQTVSGLTQYAPYVMRVHTSAVRGETNYGASISSGGLSALSFASEPTLKTAMLVVPATTANAFIDESATSPVGAGAYRDVTYASYSRCIVVDAGPNYFSRSDEAGNAAWNWTNVTVGSNAVNDPNGETIGDTITENTSINVFHTSSRDATRANEAADVCVYGMYRQTSGDRDIRLVVGSDGSNYGQALFDLSAGTVGTPSAVGTATNVRAYIEPVGGSWFMCWVIARVAASTTLHTEQIIVRASDSASQYTGDGSSQLAVVGVGAALSALPTRGARTSSAASASGESQTGSALYVKGLPASTSGLLLPEDVVEINGEIKTCTAALNSDASGLGYLQFEPALVRAPADNDPVIIASPMGKFLVSSIKIENEFGTQARVSYDLEHIYE